MNALSFSEYMESLGADRENVDRLKGEMMAAVEEQRLKEIRRSLGMTQVELAASAGISQNRVSDIENGRTTSLKISTLERYANALGCDVEVFLMPRTAGAGDSIGAPLKLAMG